jgi:threonine/homoserine/homoserine lactone efflux protein
MNMDAYLLFSVIAIATILSPGPGVLLTLTNSIRYGVPGAVGGIFGIAFGTFIVAGVSATSVGVILATSTIAFTIMKYIGALYLLYLGIKLWNSKTPRMDTKTNTTKNITIQFLEGIILQVTNPKAVFFFMSIFPQFINYSSEFIGQFILLVITYSSLVLIIHFMYAYLAKKARKWLSTPKGGKIVNRAGGGTFMFFGVGLAFTNK